MLGDHICESTRPGPALHQGQALWVAVCEEKGCVRVPGGQGKTQVPTATAKVHYKTPALGISNDDTPLDDSAKETLTKDI